MRKRLDALRRKGREFRQQHRCPNNNLFIVALILMIAFLSVELLLRIYDLYYHEPLVDVPSHFFAGMSICAGIFWILSLTEVRKIKTLSVIYTFIVAILWEIIETLQELVIDNPPYLRDIFFWDGFWDIIVTVIGGMFVFIFLSFVKRVSHFLDDVEI